MWCEMAGNAVCSTQTQVRELWSSLVCPGETWREECSIRPAGDTLTLVLALIRWEEHSSAFPADVAGGAP